MRIIGGLHRSRKLLAPEGRDTTRPITDRVKQSLFDRLAVRGYLDGGAIVDVFCGTGSLGLEALSRGVEHCTFVERDRSARDRLDRNLTALDLTDQALVLAVDALAAAWIARLPKKPVSLVFCDPPYAMMSDQNNGHRICEMITKIGPAAEPDALLMLRTDEHTTGPAIDGWTGPETHDHGSMHIHLYQHA